MISLVLMCIISLCVAKAQQKKPKQFSSASNFHGNNPRNFVINREIQRTTKEIDFGPKLPITDFVEVTEIPKSKRSRPRNQETEKSRKSRKSRETGKRSLKGGNKNETGNRHRTRKSRDRHEPRIGR